MNDEIARILDQAIDSIWQGKSTPSEWAERYPQYGEELITLLETAAQVKKVSLPEPSHQFRVQSRMRLLRHITTSQAAEKPTVVRKTAQPRKARPDIPGFRRTALSFAIVITLLVALLTTGTVYASAEAIPGDLFYPVKTTIEDIRLAVSSEEQASQLSIQFAEKRVKEIELLVMRGRLELIPVAAERYAYLLQKASQNLSAITTEAMFSQTQKSLGENISKNTEVLTRVLEQVPPSAKPAIQHALEVSDKEQKKIKEGQPPYGPPSELPKPSKTPQPTNTPHPTKTPKLTNTPKEQNVPPGKETVAPGLSPPEATKDKPGKPTPQK